MKNNTVKNKALVLVAALSLFATSAIASNLDVDINTTTNGAWIEVFENGAPVKNAIINNNYMTGGDGRVFVYRDYSGRRNMNIIVETPNGEVVNRSFFSIY